MFENPFLTDARTLRARARLHIDEGSVRVGYSVHRETVLKLLNDSLATEEICAQRYRRYQLLATANSGDSGARHFVTHAYEERGHADQIAARIVQLGGQPAYSSEDLLSVGEVHHANGYALLDLIKQDMIAECINIDSYRDIIRYLGDRDPTSRRMMEAILADEENHAREMANLLEDSPA
jgi:bacterioferritin